MNTRFINLKVLGITFSLFVAGLFVVPEFAFSKQPAVSYRCGAYNMPDIGGRRQWLSCHVHTKVCVNQYGMRYIDFGCTVFGNGAWSCDIYDAPCE